MTRKTSFTTLLVLVLFCLAIPIGLYSFVSLPFSPPTPDSTLSRLPPTPGLPPQQEATLQLENTSSTGTADAEEEIQSTKSIIADFRARHANAPQQQEGNKSPRLYTQENFPSPRYANEKLARELFDISAAVLDEEESSETLLKLLRSPDAEVRRTLLQTLGDAAIGMSREEPGDAERRLWSKLGKEGMDTLVAVAAETIVYDTQHGTAQNIPYMYLVTAKEHSRALIPVVVWSADNNPSPRMRWWMTDLAFNLDPESAEVGSLLQRRRVDSSAEVRLHALQTSSVQLLARYTGH